MMTRAAILLVIAWSCLPIGVARADLTACLGTASQAASFDAQVIAERGCVAAATADERGSARFPCVLSAVFYGSGWRDAGWFELRVCRTTLAAAHATEAESDLLATIQDRSFVSIPPMRGGTGGGTFHTRDVMTLSVGADALATLDALSAGRHVTDEQLAAARVAAASALTDLSMRCTAAAATCMSIEDSLRALAAGQSVDASVVDLQRDVALERVGRDYQQAQAHRVSTTTIQSHADALSDLCEGDPDGCALGRRQLEHLSDGRVSDLEHRTSPQRADLGQ